MSSNQSVSGVVDTMMNQLSTFATNNMKHTLNNQLTGSTGNAFGLTGATGLTGPTGRTERPVLTLEYYCELRRAIDVMLGREIDGSLSKPPDEIVYEFLARRFSQIPDEERDKVALVLERYRNNRDLIFIEHEILERFLVKVGEIQADNLSVGIRWDEVRSAHGENVLSVVVGDVPVGQFRVQLRADPIRLDMASQEGLIPDTIRRAAVEQAMDIIKRYLKNVYRPRAVGPSIYESGFRAKWSPYNTDMTTTTDYTTSGYFHTDPNAQISWDIEKILPLQAGDDTDSEEAL